MTMKQSMHQRLAAAYIIMNKLRKRRKSVRRKEAKIFANTEAAKIMLRCDAFHINPLNKYFSILTVFYSNKDVNIFQFNINFDDNIEFLEEKEPTSSPNHVSSLRNLYSKSLLVVQHRHLNPHTEMRRMFGSRVIQADHRFGLLFVPLKYHNSYYFLH